MANPDPLLTAPLAAAFSPDDDLDFNFDDLYLPSDTEAFLNSLPFPSDPPSESLPFSPDLSPDIFAADVASFLDVSSPDHPVSSQGSGNLENFGNPTSDLLNNYSSPGPASSHGSGDLGNNSDSIKDFENGEVDQKIKLEEESNVSLLKRKKGSEKSDSLETRTNKYRKPNDEEGISGISDEDDKRKARLMRNRESAQLSRQRKKHYVEELEDKVRAMHSTIHDLNSRISYVMAENASLRQQASGGVYPHPPPGMYPWVPCPPYMVKPQGSHVPLVPIPRLKPHGPALKVKKSESKSKSKKVASVSLLGFLFFMLIFGGLMPMVNLKFREMNESVSGRLDNFNNGTFYDGQKGRILTYLNGSDRDIGIGNDFVSKGHCGKTSSDSDKAGGNSSEPLVASLYVPRNDKLVKIDGNLIIHSVMASEKAMANEGVKRSEETGLAVARNNAPTIIPLAGSNRYTYIGPVERQRALSGEKDERHVADGKLQQWFTEGLAGPMLSSGMCTEVFQFDASPAPGAIIPATTVVNVSSETQHLKNITAKLVKGNRRILVGSESSNHTEKPVEKDNLRGNSSLSSMVVSVLVDPREAGDGDGDGVMGPKSISRISVVVLVDSVKYVTYSCMLPLIGSGAHLVTT